MMLLLLAISAAAAAPSVVYDQRQEGAGYNVHVQLQDFLLLYMPGGVVDPVALINSAVGYKSASHHEPEVTLPPEYENASSQAVQEAVAAAAPEIPEPETNKPETNATVTTEAPKQPPKTVKPTAQKVVHSSQKQSQKTKPHDSNSDIHQAIAVFKIKHDQQVPVKGTTEASKPQADSKITQAVIDSVKQKVEAVTEAQVRRLYDVIHTPAVSQAIALFKIKQEAIPPAASQA